MKDFGTMSDHDILVVIATKQSSMQDSIDQFHDSQAFFNAGIDARLRDVEKNGSKILSMSCSLIPQPVSATSKQAWSVSCGWPSIGKRLIAGISATGTVLTVRP